MKIQLVMKSPHSVKVSPEDYEYLSQWSWSYKRSTRKHGENIYAKRSVSIWENGVRVKTISIYMHHVVLERMGIKPRTSRHTADHINCDTLDNTRENLRWATRRQQNRNQRRYK